MSTKKLIRDPYAAQKSTKVVLEGVRVKFQLLKPHGSTNWLYCDGVPRSLLVAARLDGTSGSDFVPRAGLGDRWKRSPARSLAKRDLGAALSHLRSNCARHTARHLQLSKGVGFPMHEGHLATAEALLAKASTWIFFGYSMPGADFEFKHC